MFEIVDRLTTDGRRSDWYTISSPMSLGSGELIISKTNLMIIVCGKLINGIGHVL